MNPMRTGKQVVVRFTQGCSRVGCFNTWTLTRARMFMITDEDWGNQRCLKHRVSRKN